MSGVTSLSAVEIAWPQVKKTIFRLTLAQAASSVREL
jgi:hypothetical protein